MPPKRQIRAKDVVADIRSGLTNEDLIKKHQLSANSLQEILRKLVDAGALMEIELQGRTPMTPEAPEAETTTETDSKRREMRSYVVVRLPVYDLNNLTVEGNVHDISETGLMVGGLRAAEGDTRSLLIQADEFADVYPFTFDAECRWAEAKEDDADCLAGFEITNISDVGKQELRKLCKLLAFS